MWFLSFILFNEYYNNLIENDIRLILASLNKNQQRNIWGYYVLCSTCSNTDERIRKS